MNHSPERPLVSLITPGWNGAAFVSRLLDSILQQTYRPLEYLYIDDGSTDGTDQVVRSYAGAFAREAIDFRLVRKANGGVCTALNEGLRLFSGDYLCWPEYDDFFSPDSIEKRVNFLETHPDYAVVTTDAYVCLESEPDRPVRLLSQKAPQRLDENQFEHLLLSRSIFVAGCHMARARCFLETHPDRTLLVSPIGPNWQMLLPLYHQYKRGFIDEPLFHNVIRADSLSHRRQDYRERLGTLAEYERVIRSVLAAMDMPEPRRQHYFSLVQDKYNRERFALAIRNGDRPSVRRCYRQLRSRSVNTRKDDAKYWLLGHPMLARAYYRLRSGDRKGTG